MDALIFWLMPAITIICLILTGMVRNYALARRLLDIPNTRSSHVVATPRGGGIAIVASYLGAIILLMASDAIAHSMAWALLGAGSSIALLGFLDDHGHIAARWRLLGHVAAAIWILGWLGSFPPLEILGWQWDLGWLGFIIGALYLVWLLNLYNFMDGIDGIASVEAICVCVGSVLIYLLLDQSKMAVLPGLLACAVTGFLYWNFPPARIFMGDAGSGFLGIMLGALSLQAGFIAPQLLWAWLILLGVFIVDATTTLGRRFFRGEKVYEAHRNHAYQHASRRYGHLRVTISVLLINLVWLLPLAVMVGTKRIDGVIGIIMAYLPLLFIAIRFNAGKL